MQNRDVAHERPTLPRHRSFSEYGATSRVRRIERWWSPHRQMPKSRRRTSVVPSRSMYGRIRRMPCKFVRSWIRGCTSRALPDLCMAQAIALDLLREGLKECHRGGVLRANTNDPRRSARSLHRHRSECWFAPIPAVVERPARCDRRHERSSTPPPFLRVLPSGGCARYMWGPCRRREEDRSGSPGRSRRSHTTGQRCHRATERGKQRREHLPGPGGASPGHGRDHL